MCWKYSHVTFYRTEFPAAEMELVADEPGWSPSEPSTVMVDDDGILAFQVSNKSSSIVVSAQPGVDACGAAAARQSVPTQTDRPGTAEALVNTEVVMSDLDYLAEVRGGRQRAVLAGQTVKHIFTLFRSL